MIYYAKDACMIDGVSYNAGEIVPESVIKTAGANVQELVRKEGEKVTAPKANPTGLMARGRGPVSVSATAQVNQEEDGDDELPKPDATSDAKTDSTDTKDTTATTSTEDATTSAPAPSAPVVPKGDTKKDKDTK